MNPKKIRIYFSHEIDTKEAKSLLSNINLHLKDDQFEIVKNEENAHVGLFFRRYPTIIPGEVVPIALYCNKPILFDVRKHTAEEIGLFIKLMYLAIVREVFFIKQLF